ncbi:MAG: serine hydrolase [Acidobacteria bacterium]|nr:serine hydrolase [Acidobacteriota bacterium]MBI3425204.1 serine hydrolase [Acidobacteriota bacterium]
MRPLRFSLAFVLLFTAHLQALAQVPATSPLDAQIRAEIAQFKGQVWLHAKNLDTGATYSLNGDQRTRTASTIKLPIMVATFGLVADGKLKWTDELVLTDAKKVAGSGILFEFHDGLKITLRDSVHLMITISDNTATNLVLDAVTADEVNARMDALGFKNLRSLRKINGGGESRAFSDASNKRADGTTYGIGMSTPQEMVALLERLERGEIISPAASQEMIAILKRQQVHDGVGRHLKGVTIANKTGALDALRADVGILYAPRGRIAYAITTDYMPEADWSPDNPGLLLLSRLSELLLDGLGKPPETKPAPPKQEEGSAQLSKQAFDNIEGHFHDALGTYAELLLANQLIAQGQLTQMPFAVTKTETKLNAALAQLPATDARRARLQREVEYIRSAAQQGARALLTDSGRTLATVRHTAREFADAHAADVRLEFTDGTALPVSVKTDKSNKVAVAEGQTPDLFNKWLARYFNVSREEYDGLIRELGFADEAELKANYRHVARLVAEVLIRKLALSDCAASDFSRARATNLAAAQHLFKQLRHYKHGNDASRVIIFDRVDGEVKWDSRLDALDVNALTAERISFLPARPRNGAATATEFGLKIDRQTVVTFQIKHRRGKAKGTARQYEFSDLTTRLSL